MPVKISKTKKGCYRVSTPNGTRAKCTTKAKAQRQKNLLNALENNPNFHATIRRNVVR